MELGISTYGSSSIRRYTPVSSKKPSQRISAAEALAVQKKTVQKQAKAAAEEAQAKLKSQGSSPDPEKYLDDILRFTNLFNRKLKFSVNRQLQQVVVKVVDRDTDKVIKEIPPEALQRLHERMQEVMGLLIDEEI